MSVKPTRALILGLLLATALAAVAALTPLVADANGRVTQFTRKTAGPYEIAVGTVPSTPVVGNFDLTITIADATSKAFILDANITVNGRGPEDPQGGQITEVGPLAAQNTPFSPVYYDAIITVNRVGTWTFTVKVSSRLGEASADFPIEVKKANPLTAIITLVTLLAFVAIMGFSVRAYLRERGRKNASRRKA